jgi:hypothetical protein
MPRFQVGAAVRIRDTISTPHSNKIGVILQTLPHKRHIRTLDRYIVGLPSGVELNVWDIQLESPQGTETAFVSSLRESGKD